jgi:DNA-binding transcriptional ArsR family regulator
MQGIRAIADPFRREILELLHTTPLPAHRIAEHFSISRPAVSRHLRVLSECGVVEVAVTGRQRIYRLRAEPLTEVAAYLERLLRPALPNRFDALATEVARARRERRSVQSSASDTEEQTA